MPEIQTGADAQENLDWYDRIGDRVRVFVRGWRRFDAWTLQPLSLDRARGWQLLAPAEYPWFIPVLGALLVFGVTVGPYPFYMPTVTLGLFGLGLVLLLLLHAWAMRSPWLRVRLLAGYLGILLLLGGLLVAVAVLFPTSTFDPADTPLRLHVGPAIALALAFMLWPASWMAGRMVQRVPNEVMPSALPMVELFPPKARYDFKGDTSGLTLMSIALLVPIRYPVQLLLPASLAALVLPSRWLFLACIVLLALAWAALFLGVLFDRLMEILTTLGRLFFIGPQRILSAIVIAIAGARWLGVHYITYLFDAPGGNWTVLFYIFFAYAVAWFYGFWCEILLARRFIRLLTDKKGRPSEVDYAFVGDEAISRVRNRDRTIALHGAGRLMVKGMYEPDYDTQYRHRRDPSDAGRTALTFLTPSEMLAEFRTQLEDRGRVAGPDPLPRVRDLQRAVFVYPGVTTLLMLAFIGGPLLFGRFGTGQAPELDVVRHGGIDDHINLRLQPLLLGDGRALSVAGANDACPPLDDDSPRIVVAASGGGTRAAIYTASVLRSLAAQARICNVVLASGVSGGSAALAYFALKQDLLRTPVYDDAAKAAWDAFESAMAEPYIQEVLNAASDSAVVFGTWRWRDSVCGEGAQPRDERPRGFVPTRVRSGNLLAESFVCKMGPGSMESVRFGLILNTGLIGRFQPLETSDIALTERARRAAGDPIRASDLAGGRLILTNVPQPHEAEKPPSGQGTRDLRFISINDPEMSVARAAALSANFPPVFSDAAIDGRYPETKGKDDKRFWVTDGGTVENRGVVTLYLSIEDALDKRELEHKLRPDEPERDALESLLDDKEWPPLHVVIADVSAVGGPYKESYGLQSVQSAGGQMGLALEAELLDDLQRLYGDHESSVTVHELPMPAVLRDGIGTHWMIPNNLDFANPETPGDERSLSKPEVLGLARGLFSAPPVMPIGDVEEVRRWTCHVPAKRIEEASAAGNPRPAPPHAEAWERLTAALGVTGQTPCIDRRVAGSF